jgi:hypothetical protein
LRLLPENFYFGNHRQTIDQQKAVGCRTAGLATVGKLRRLNIVNKHNAYFADGRQIGFPLSATTLLGKKDATLQGSASIRITLQYFSPAAMKIYKKKDAPPVKRSIEFSIVGKRVLKNRKQPESLFCRPSANQGTVQSSNVQWVYLNM